MLYIVMIMILVLLKVVVHFIDSSCTYHNVPSYFTEVLSYESTAVRRYESKLQLICFLAHKVLTSSRQG